MRCAFGFVAIFLSLCSCFAPRLPVACVQYAVREGQEALIAEGALLFCLSRMMCFVLMSPPLPCRECVATGPGHVWAVGSACGGPCKPGRRHGGQEELLDMECAVLLGRGFLEREREREIKQERERESKRERAAEFGKGRENKEGRDQGRG